MKSHPLSLQQGFSIIEILIAVTIMGILATVVILNIGGAPDEARSAKAKQDIKTLESALEIYKLNNFSYPSTDQGLEALVSRPSGQPAAPNWKPGGYIKQLPKDPWGNEYQYLNPGSRGEYDLWTYGADGQSGGEGTAADIGNWSR